MILRQKALNQFLFLVHKLKHYCSCRTKNLAWCPSTIKITGTKIHHKLILYSSCHVPRLLVVATRVEQGTIRVGNKQILVINGALIVTTVTQREKSCHNRWYMFLLHWIIQSSIHISCPWFINNRPDLHIRLFLITSALIAKAVTQIAMNCHHGWYLCLLHWMIQSLIQLIFPRFVNSHSDLHIKQRMSCKVFQYPVRLHLIGQIPCHRRPPIMEVGIFFDAWLMCLSCCCEVINLDTSTTHQVA